MDAKQRRDFNIWCFVRSFKIHARRNPTKAPMQSCIAYGLEYDWRQNEGLVLAATQKDE